MRWRLGIDATADDEAAVELRQLVARFEELHAATLAQLDRTDCCPRRGTRPFQGQACVSGIADALKAIKKAILLEERILSHSKKLERLTEPPKALKKIDLRAQLNINEQ